MLERIRNNKKIVQIFLVLITLPFAFWGVESYVRNAESSAEVASVDGNKIYMQDLQAALREQQERLRPQLGAQFDPAIFNTPQMRRAVLDSLVNQRLLARHSTAVNLSVSDAELIRFISNIPALQDGGKFSSERYAALVAGQGMSKEAFEARLRQDLATQQLLLPIGEAGIPGQTSASRWMLGQLEQREIAELRLLPEAYVAQVKILPEAITAYYEANRKKFEVPEQLRAEYITLTQDALLEPTSVSAEDIKARYQSRLDSFKTAETRRASHILIGVKNDAPEAERKAGQAKAAALLAQLQKAPGDFARLAKESSQDPGSAAKGGDLDWFGRGMMVKPFEDAAFALKEGQTSALVQSDFGFHIIRITGIRPERVKPLDEVQAEITTELKREWVTKKYAEVAEAFGNTVYEQADSLKPAAEKWKLPIRQSEWMVNVTKTGGKLPPPFNNAKLATSLFGDDAIKNKRNSEAVEISPGNMVAARVLEHIPASLQPLESVRTAIEKRLIRDEALKLASQDGEEKLARLKKGEAADLKWSPSRSISRVAAQGMPPELLRTVFKADATTLPTHAGGELAGNGYVLFKISAVKPVEVGASDPRTKALSQQYARMVAEEEFSAWLATLREKYKVVVSNTQMESKEP